MPFDGHLQKPLSAERSLTSEMELFHEALPVQDLCRYRQRRKNNNDNNNIRAVKEAQGYTVHLGGNIGRAALLCDVDDMKASDVAVLEQLISAAQHGIQA